MKSIDVDYVLNSIPPILQYLPMTLSLALFSMIAGLVIGFFSALVQFYKTPVLKQFSSLYVSFIRGTPLLVQLFLVYYGFPLLYNALAEHFVVLQGFNINSVPPEFFAILAFSLNLGGYLSETIRSAIESIDKGQFEAAESIGMSRMQTMYHVILPQATLIALPNLGNTLISMVKDTSLAFMIMVMEMMGQAKIIGARGLRIFEVYLAVSLIYWATCFLLEKILYRLEKRLKASQGKIA